MKIIGVIPARFFSRRLPGKPLKEIFGKPLIQYVYEQAQKIKRLDWLVVATDDERILKKVREFGGEAKLTSANCPSGSDRIAEIMKNIESELVVNIQGDEPFFAPEMIEEMIDVLIKNPELPVSTLCFPIENQEEIKDKNVVKVVLDRNDFALYFSRSPIPYFREGKPRTTALPLPCTQERGLQPWLWGRTLRENRSHSSPSSQTGLSVVRGKGLYFKHLGFYAFRRAFLLEFTRWTETPLEKAEKLEQLRILENGYRIKVVKSKFDSLGIDTREDLEKAKEILKTRLLKNEKKDWI